MLINKLLARLQSYLQSLNDRLSDQVLVPAYCPIKVHNQANRR